MVCSTSENKEAFVRSPGVMPEHTTKRKSVILTKILITGIVTNEIRALDGLSSQGSYNVGVRLDLLERTGLLYERVRIVKNLHQLQDDPIPVFLGEDDLKGLNYKDQLNTRY